MTVRIEGRTHTLLAPTKVQTHTGSITEGGARVGACSATSAVGALDAATHHRWGSPYESKLGGIEITSIFGGIARIVARHKGTLVLRTGPAGYIRAVPVRVHVSG